jgi:hypothetical protein
MFRIIVEYRRPSQNERRCSRAARPYLNTQNKVEESWRWAQKADDDDRQEADVGIWWEGSGLSRPAGGAITG